MKSVHAQSEQENAEWRARKAQEAAQDAEKAQDERLKRRETNKENAHERQFMDAHEEVAEARVRQTSRESTSTRDFQQGEAGSFAAGANPDATQGDPEQGDPEQGNATQGDPEQGNPEQGDATQGDPEQGDPEPGDGAAHDLEGVAKAEPNVGVEKPAESSPTAGFDAWLARVEADNAKKSPESDKDQGQNLDDVHQQDIDVS